MRLWAATQAFGVSIVFYTHKWPFRVWYPMRWYQMRVILPPSSICAHNKARIYYTALIARSWAKWWCDIPITISWPVMEVFLAAEMKTSAVSSRSVCQVRVNCREFTERKIFFSYLALQRGCAFDFFNHFWSKTLALSPKRVSNVRKLWYKSKKKMAARKVRKRWSDKPIQ